MQIIITKTNNLICSQSKKRIKKGQRISVEYIDGELNGVLCMECEGCKKELFDLEMLQYEHSMEW